MTGRAGAFPPGPVLLALVLLLCASAQAATFPALQPASAFSGEETEDGLRSRAELYLLDRHFFVLSQHFEKGGRTFNRDLTGFWRQSADNALLHLTNHHGLNIRLNVGGMRTLYGFLPAFGHRGHVFRLHMAQFAMPRFTVMGELDRGPEGLTLRDSATGKIFTFRGPVPYSGETPRFVDAEIRYGPQGSSLERIRSSSPSAPMGPAPTQTLDFADITGILWVIPPLPGTDALSCLFTPADASHGTAEISGRGFWLLAEYTVHDANLAFSVDQETLRMLHGLKAEGMESLLTTTRTWFLEGDVPVLETATGERIYLERPGKTRRPRKH